MNQRSVRSCDFIARTVRHIAKWVFASVLNHYLGSGPLILKGMGKDGGDIKFAATDRWMERNQITNFGAIREDIPEFAEHIKTCKSEGCVEARRRLELISDYWAKGKLPGGDTTALVSVFAGRRDGLTLARGGTWDDVIDEFMKVMPWFEEDEVLEQYHFLVDRKYVHGLNPAEVLELARLSGLLDEMDKDFYDPIIHSLVEKEVV